MKTLLYMIVNKVNSKAQYTGAEETQHCFHGVVVFYVNHQKLYHRKHGKAQTVNTERSQTEREAGQYKQNGQNQQGTTDEVAFDAVKGGQYGYHVEGNAQTEINTDPVFTCVGFVLLIQTAAAKVQGEKNEPETKERIVLQRTAVKQDNAPNPEDVVDDTYKQVCGSIHNLCVGQLFAEAGIKGGAVTQHKNRKQKGYMDNILVDGVSDQERGISENISHAE